MENQNVSSSFSLAYDNEKDKIVISFQNENNAIEIPSSVYVPFISVLIRAGIDFQKDNVVNLGLADFISELEEE